MMRGMDVPRAEAATRFLSTHGRLLDRRRLAMLLGPADGPGVLAALDAYRNPDGGYGWGLEPDLRTAGSQPAAAMHALEVLAELGPVVTTPAAVRACDWLLEHTLPDGGLPLALPVARPSGCAPFWVQADPAASSLQMTAQVAAQAHRLGHHQPEVAAHPWLPVATRYCLDAIRTGAGALHAHELLFAVHFLDAVADRESEAGDLLALLGGSIGADGRVRVHGGSAEECLYPLDFAPWPDRPARTLFSAEAIAADLQRLASLQQPDGGWVVDFASYSPAAELEWRAYTTVRAVGVVLANGA
jgi:hypothetical protein